MHRNDTSHEIVVLLSWAARLYAIDNDKNYTSTDMSIEYIPQHAYKCQALASYIVTQSDCLFRLEHSFPCHFLFRLLCTASSN